MADPEPVAFAKVALDFPVRPVVETAEPAFEIVFQVAPDAVRPHAQPVAMLEGHGRFVQGLAFSHDARLLATGSEDGTIRLWDVQARVCIAVTEPGAAVNSVAFTADGTQLLSASDDRAVRLWSVPALACVRTLTGHADYVSRVFPAGPGRAASAGKDGTIRLWDLATGECLHVMEHGYWVYALAISPDGRRALAANDRNQIRLWDLATGQIARVILGAELGPFHGGNESPRRIAFTPDGRTFVTSSRRELVHWDVATGAELARIGGDGWPIEGLAVIPDRARLRADAEPVERAFVEALQTDEQVRAVYGDWLEQQGREADADRVRRHDPYVFGGTHGAVHVFDLGRREIIAQAPSGNESSHDAAVTPDGRFAAVGCQDGPIALWDLDELLAAGMPDHHLKSPSELAVSCGGVALSVTSDRTAWLWNAGGKNLRLPPFQGVFAMPAFSTDGRFALVMSEDAELQVYDATTGQSCGTAQLPADAHTSGAFSAYALLRDGRLLSAPVGGALAIWTLDPPAYLGRFAEDPGHVTALAVDEEADLVVTAEHTQDGDPMRVKLWSLAHRALVRTVELASTDRYGNRAAIVRVDGEIRIVLGTTDRGLVILDREGRVRHALELPFYPGEYVPLSDGRVLVDGQPAAVLDVRTGMLVEGRTWPMPVELHASDSPRVAVSSDTGVAVFDLATDRCSAFTPVSGRSVAVSANLAYVAVTSNEGLPMILRRTR
jgi:WD40 repeat protein